MAETIPVLALAFCPHVDVKNHLTSRLQVPDVRTKVKTKPLR